MTAGAASALQLVAGLCVLALAAAALVRERGDWRRRGLPQAPRPVPTRAWRAVQRTTLPAAGAAAAAGSLLVIDALAGDAARPLRVLLGVAFVTGLALAVSTALAARPRCLVPPALRRRRGPRANGASSRGDSGPAT